MRDPSRRPRTGRFQQYRRSNSLSALSPPSYDESERDTAQSVSNVETPLPNYEEAMLRSSSLHDLLEPPRVPLPEIPADWNQAGPSGEGQRDRCHTSTTDSERQDHCVKALCYSCCCVFLLLVLWLVFMGLALHFVQPRNFLAAWVIFSIMFFLPILICIFPCLVPTKRTSREE